MPAARNVAAASAIAVAIETAILQSNCHFKIGIDSAGHFILGFCSKRKVRQASHVADGQRDFTKLCRQLGMPPDCEFILGSTKRSRFSRTDGGAPTESGFRSSWAELYKLFGKGDRFLAWVP